MPWSAQLALTVPPAAAWGWSSCLLPGKHPGLRHSHLGRQLLLSLTGISFQELYHLQRDPFQGNVLCVKACTEVLISSVSLISHSLFFLAWIYRSILGGWWIHVRSSYRTSQMFTTKHREMVVRTSCPGEAATSLLSGIGAWPMGSYNPQQQQGRKEVAFWQNREEKGCAAVLIHMNFWQKINLLTPPI